MPPPKAQSVSKELKQIKNYLNTVNTRLTRIEDELELEPIGKAKATQPEPEKKVTNQKQKSEHGFEANIGLKWLGKVGILSLVLGVGFFIKYAFDNNWVSLLGRVIIGVLIGLGVIAAGEFFDRKKAYERLARTLTGGGFAIVYFAIYSAYHFPRYREAIGMTLEVNLVLLSIIVLLAVIFALRYNSSIIASGAFFLGYLTSFLSIHIGVTTVLYCLILSVGIIIVSSIKKWGYMSVGGIIATYVLFMLWFFDTSQNILYSISFLVTYFIIFTVNAFAFKSTKEDPAAENYGPILTFINSVCFYGFSYLWIDDNYPTFKGLFTLTMAAIHLVLAYLSSSMQIKKLINTHLILLVSFITLTIPIQLNNQYVTLVWAIEALVLLAIAFQIQSAPLRLMGYLLSILVAGKTLFLDSFQLAAFSFSNILGSTRFFTYLVAIATFYFSALLIEKHYKQLSKDEESIPKVYYLSALVFLTVLIALELDKYWISVAWGVEALVLLVLGFMLQTKERRLAGIALLGLTIAKVFFLDLSEFDTVVRIISFMGLGVILLIASFLYAKYKDVILKDD